VRIAVLQHAFRADPAADADALVVAAASAAALGAEVIVLPEVPSVHTGSELDAWWQRVALAVPDARVLVPHVGRDNGSAAFEAELDPLGRVAMLSGDAAIDPEVLRQTADRGADVVVLAPRSESDLQAEAVLECAMDLSLSVVSLVLVVEPDGAETGVPGHGGSAIVYLGEAMAEAASGDDTLIYDIELPLTPPEPRGPLPAVAPILAQRLAAHRGQKLDVPYPADLS
jgi:predicted amidohydrolase